MTTIQKITLTILAMTMFLSANLFAQDKQGNAAKRKAVTLNGKVIDANNSEPLMYVNVILLNPKDSSLVSGGTTNEKGLFSFETKLGKYIMKVSYIGYKDIFRDIELKEAATNLGTLQMTSKATNLGAVEVSAQKSMMEYQLDKRVINIDQNIVTAGGDATDVLQSLPSVSVDEDGNVTLRGNSNVKVLIDGKPSELLGNDLATVLQQIPASTIESVEEITNPSAKYDPEGMSGIINIKLKEKEGRGLQGNFSVSGGSALQKLTPRSNASFGINYSTNKFALFAQADGRFSTRANKNDGLKFLFSHDTNMFSNIIRSQRKGQSENLSGGIKLGADWYINKKNTLTFTYGGRMFGSLSDWDTINNTDLFLADSPREVLEADDESRNGQFHNFAINYTKKFSNPEQELTLDANYNIGLFGNESTQLMDYSFISDYEKKDESESRSNRAVVMLDYVHPFSKKARLDVGYNLNYSFGNSYQDYFINGNSQRDDAMSYTYNNDEQIHAIYATFGYSFNDKLSAQAGLRAEVFSSNGTRKIISDTAVKFETDYNSLYPTLHLSYAFTKTQSAQISYSRRVNRPRGWDLLPTVDISNPEQIRLGNPDLKPEYTDAYELGYSVIFPTTTIFASAYYRQTNDRITWYNFLWNTANAHDYGFDWALAIAGDEVDKGKLAMTSMNITKSYNYGLELIIDQQIAKWWKINVSGNLFGNYTDGSALGAAEVKSLNWDVKLTSTMTLPHDWNIQLSAQYLAPQKTIQGDNKAMYFADLAVRKSFWNKKGSLALRFSDIFNTRKRVGRTLTDDYFNFSYRKPYSQSINLTFSYRFGETKPKQDTTKRRNNQENQDNSIMESGEYYGE
ncbi:MAG: TonB-dependent receptor family protein [Bacteroidales bacterium]|jgi:outer membrane receptor protein involved in Fe transport|nr:TonB-dependent receptor family protein [Bacteroidales bacterium]